MLWLVCLNALSCASFSLEDRHIARAMLLCLKTKTYIQPITSKLTDSYLGLAGSILYPHFGLGVSDVVKLNQYPLAFGGYLYLNHEDTNAFVLNSDLRAACVYRFFTCDLALGLGLPVKTANQDDYIIAVERLYWHLGTTILIGNNYTNSLFIQGGLFNATFQ